MMDATHQTWVIRIENPDLGLYVELDLNVDRLVVDEMLIAEHAAQIARHAFVMLSRRSQEMKRALEVSR